MRILYLCTYFHQALLYRVQMDGLKKRGHEVKVFNSARIGEGIDDKFKSAIDEDVVHIECWKPMDRLLFFPRQFKIEKELLNSYNPECFDLLHAHLMLSSGWTARRIKHKYGLKYVVSVRATDLIGWIKMPFFHKMAINNVLEAEGVIFLSKSLRDQFINKFVPDKFRQQILDKSEVIGNPLEKYWEENRLQTGKILDKKKTIHILSVARVNKVKNLPLAAKAIKILNEQGYNADFTVVGAVEDEEELNELKKFEFVMIEPFSDLNGLRTYYESCDIFLLPSKIETFGRVYVEAMSQGLPVLYSRGQGFDNVYPDGFVGYAVDSNDETDICRCLQKTIENYDILSDHCVTACEDFFEKQIVNKIENFYKKSLK